jgi:4-amino-4-deoxy-L-arabinose transferase-like glycosyltransferase
MLRRIGLWASTVISLALIALWIRSAYAGDRITITRDSGEVLLRSDTGVLEMTYQEQSPNPRGTVREVTRPGYQGIWPGRATSKYDLYLLNYQRGTSGPTAYSGPTAPPTWEFFTIKTYHPVPIVLFALPGLFALKRRWQFGRRRRGGRCVACGYDLRASAERCPECGAAVAGAGAASATAAAT